MSLKKLKVFNNFGKLTIYQSTTNTFTDFNGQVFKNSYGIFSSFSKTAQQDLHIIMAPDKLFKAIHGKDWKIERALTLRHEFKHYADWIFRHSDYNQLDEQTVHIMIYNHQMIERAFNLSGSIDWIFKK